MTATLPKPARPFLQLRPECKGYGSFVLYLWKRQTDGSFRVDPLRVIERLCDARRVARRYQRSFGGVLLLDTPVMP